MHDFMRRVGDFYSRLWFGVEEFAIFTVRTSFRSFSCDAFFSVVRLISPTNRINTYLDTHLTTTTSHTETSQEIFIPRLEAVKAAELAMRGVVRQTALEHSANLSEEFGANVYLKREDLQIVRSYKIRGAYNKISSLPADVLARGVVCASAGNHAQGVALS